jgi:hypothetical protein
MLENITLLDAEQLRSASKEQITSILTQLNKTSESLNTQLLNLRVTVETKQNERNILVKEIESKYGVTSIEALEQLKKEKIEELIQLGNELKTIINQG